MRGRLISSVIRRRALLGRMSLNPVVHIDPIGTILLPLVAALSGLPIIGWAKPVPVNVSRLRHRAAISCSWPRPGPTSNMLLAVARRGR